MSQAMVKGSSPKKSLHMLMLLWKQYVIHLTNIEKTTMFQALPKVLETE